MIRLRVRNVSETHHLNAGSSWNRLATAFSASCIGLESLKCFTSTQLSIDKATSILSLLFWVLKLRVTSVTSTPFIVYLGTTAWIIATLMVAVPSPTSRTPTVVGVHGTNAAFILTWFQNCKSRQDEIVDAASKLASYESRIIPQVVCAWMSSFLMPIKPVHFLGRVQGLLGFVHFHEGFIEASLVLLERERCLTLPKERVEFGQSRCSTPLIRCLTNIVFM